MYSFFGILDRSGHRYEEEHRQSAASVRSKFSTRSAGFQLVQREGLTFFGQGIRSARIRNMELFLIGELYNADEIRKMSGSDAAPEEALLHLILQQGESMISTLNGSFALILIHHDTRQCRIYNDQMGAMQVFYHVQHDFLVFGNELKYLFCHPRCPREINWTASLKRPIPFLIVNAERHQDAWFQDIHLLEEGNVLVCPAAGECQISPYWDPWQNVSRMGNTSVHKAEEYADAYMALLEDAVRIRCAADQSASSMFSGGMDSTVIAALAAKHGAVDTFSFATPATVRDGATAMGLQLAQDLGMTNMQVLVPFDDLVSDGNLWFRQVWSMESPFTHKDAIGKTALHAAIEAVRPDIRHIMSGTGSDQLNGGLVRWFVEDAEEGSHEANWQRVMKEIRTEMLKPVIGHQYDTFWGCRDLLRHDYLAALSPTPLNNYPWPEFVRGCLHANQYVLVWDELRAGAWSQRGVQFPFMDYRFVPFLLSIPREYHSQLFFDKQILRQGAHSILPSYLTSRPKAPVIKPGEDKRMTLYKEILLGRDGYVLGELLDIMRKRDCPVDPLSFERSVMQLAEKPDQAAWTYLMHLAGLVALSRLPELGEQDIDIRGLVMPQVDVIETAGPKDITRISKSLDVPLPEEILQMPLGFASDCTLVSDEFTHEHFLVRDGTMCYQLDPEVPDWYTFLRSLDGMRSADAICREKGLDLKVIREFLQISLEEGILSTRPTLEYHA